MKQIRIDFTKHNPLIDGFIVGRIGEHNATKLLITPPAYMQENGDISFYYVVFETGGKVYHSDRIEKAEIIEVSLWKQLTENRSLAVQLEACSTDESVLEKSILLTGLCFLPSACGEVVDNCVGTGSITRGIEIVKAQYGYASEIIIYGMLPTNLVESSMYFKKITLVDIDTLPFRAFDGLTGMEEIVGVENVVRLDTGTFGSCYALKTVNLNPNLTSIEPQTFLNCRALEKLDVPESVKSIGDKAFEECRTLPSINLQNCETIGDRAFYNCTSLNNIVLSDSLKIIGEYAFYYCVALEIEEISVATRIHKYAFCQDRGIKNLTLYSPFIDTYAFGYCTNLKTLKIKEGTVLGTNCFYNCTSLETCEFEGGINFIPVSCFAQCTKLDIPYIKVASSINSSAFTNTGMTEIAIDCPVIGTNAFERCSQLKSVTLINTTTINNYAFYSCPLLETATLPNNVDVAIGGSAFYSCRNLKTVNIPRLKSMAATAFGSCSSLENVVIGSKGYPVSDIPATAFSYCSSEGMKISVYVDDPSTPLEYQPWGATQATIEYLQA